MRRKEFNLISRDQQKYKIKSEFVSLESRAAINNNRTRRTWGKSSFSVSTELSYAFCNSLQFKAN